MDQGTQQLISLREKQEEERNQAYADLEAQSKEELQRRIEMAENDPSLNLTNETY